MSESSQHGQRKARGGLEPMLSNARPMPASVGQQAIARFLDAVLNCALSYFVVSGAVAVAHWYERFCFLGERGRCNEISVWYWLAVMALGAAAVLREPIAVARRGASLADRLCGLRVVARDGSARVSWRAAFVRWGPVAVSAAGAAWVLRTAVGSAHDGFTNTGLAALIVDMAAYGLALTSPAAMVLWLISPWRRDGLGLQDRLAATMMVRALRPARRRSQPTP